MHKNEAEQSIIKVKFYPCGAEFHPAFSGAKFEENSNGFHYWVLEFPIHIKGINKSKFAQNAWADEKIKHLLSWGAQGIKRW